MTNRTQRRRAERFHRYLSPKSQLKQARYIPRALHLVWMAAAGWAMASTVLLVIQGVLPVFTVYLTREMVNALVAVIDSHGDAAAIELALMTGLLMGAVFLTRQLLNSVQSYVNTMLTDQTQDQMYGLIHDKTTSVDMDFFESASYYDQFKRASSDALTKPLSLLQNINSLLQSSITLLAMIGVLFTFAWWVPLLLLLGALPAFGVTLYISRTLYKWRLDNTINQRRLEYYHNLLTSNQAATELRLFELGDYFKPTYNELRRKLRSERLAIRTKGMIGQLGASFFGLLGLLLAMVWMLWQALQGTQSLGDLAMFWQTLNQGQRLMSSLLGCVSSIYDDILFLEDLFTFLDLEPQLADPTDPVQVPAGLNQGIEVSGVSFSYPDSKLMALENFNLTIPSGRMVAIVGKNGAGKSTLLKLLCRFYDPKEGCITWDGVDLRAMSQSDLRRRITVLFQKPLSFDDSAGNNIRFGDLAGQPTQSKIEAAALAGGAQPIIDKLPDGYETLLGKRFGQSELSVGEWQRLCLARAFVRRADLVILDEPTSAMDSWAENEWMERFRELVGGRTSVIITHRFTTAMQADIIHVMIDGCIVESGNHRDLMAMDGYYAQSWRKQMQKAVRQNKNGNGVGSMETLVDDFSVPWRDLRNIDEEDIER
ncbi:MAG: ABC transporter ATP-binding protein [Anaerolineae bacterium]|nr:ABC transporter ATP-binding protein [Anaerolineae bacterium]